MKTKNQKKEATTLAKAKTYIGDPTKTKVCPKCKKELSLTSQYWWIYTNMRKGEDIEANIYYPNCKECYKAYRKKQRAKAKRKAKKISKSSKEGPAKSAKKKVASKKQPPKKKSKATGDTKHKAPKVANSSPFFLVNSKDEVKKIIPTKIGAKRNHIYIVKNWRE